jgi:microcystin degradation protein MlrC
LGRAECWRAAPLSPDAAIAAAEAAGRWPCVLADGGDNTGGGAPGDATAMLRRFLITPALQPAAVALGLPPAGASEKGGWEIRGEVAGAAR